LLYRRQSNGLTSHRGCGSKAAAKIIPSFIGVVVVAVEEGEGGVGLHTSTIGIL